jgi:hypothetical protein
MNPKEEIWFWGGRVSPHESKTRNLVSDYPEDNCDIFTTLHRAMFQANVVTFVQHTTKKDVDS